VVGTFGLTHIALAVRDAEHSLRFYQQVFGVEVAFRDATTIQVTTPGCHDVIVFDQSAAHPGRGGRVTHFGFRLLSAADIDLAVAEVGRAGGKILRRGEFSPGFPQAYVVDPDGYQIEIWYE
jgi:catechol 2,3-dioxygenase-like lactoylglutathione lyase family enzyme